MDDRALVLLALIALGGCHRTPLATDEPAAGHPTKTSLNPPRPSAPAALAVTDFAGKWKGTMPSSLAGAGAPLQLDIDFDEAGSAFPTFRESSGELVRLAGSTHAKIRPSDDGFRVTLVKDWSVHISEDRRSMTWTDPGGSRMILAKQD